MTLTLNHIRWYRLRRSGLLDPFDSLEACTTALAGVQAQILSAAALSLWNRTTGLDYATFETQLYEERTLIKLWGQRSTLHLYTTTDWPLLCAAQTDYGSWWLRRLQRDGGDVAAYKQVLTDIAAFAQKRGLFRRADLRQAEELTIDEEYLSSWGGVFKELVWQGDICHAGQQQGEGCFAHRTHWLPDLVWQPPSPEAANIELVRRYLHTYGPATVQDLAYWRGIKVGQAKASLTTLVDEVAEVEFEGQRLLMVADDITQLHEKPPPPSQWPIRMLYRFDPLLLAHKDKSWLLDLAYYKQVWRAAGHIEGTILVGGQLVGTWRYARHGAGLKITVSPFTTLTKKAVKVIERQSKQIADFFGQPLQSLQW